MMAYVIGIAYMIGQFTQHLFQHVVALMPQ